jgi:alpha-galactosidase
MVPLTLLPLVILASAARPSLAPPTAAEARLRPPRGYNPCNGLNCDMSSLGEDALRSLAASIATNGMRDANYSWFNLDDGIVASRDPSGTMVADKRGFPSQTLLPLATYVNGLGLALGAYTDRGTATCEGRPGSKGHEAHDAATWVSWGVRYLKSDSCHSSPDFSNATEDYTAMSEGLKGTGEDVFFSLCGWFVGFAGFSALPLGDTWRIGTDVPNLARFTINIESAAAASNFTGPGKGWPDVDMIGGHWNEAQEQLHLNFIAVIGAPLLLSWNVSNPAASTLPLSAYLNSEILAIHSDDAAPSVRARGHYYARIAGGAVTGAATQGISSPSVPVDTSVPCDDDRALFTWTPSAGSQGWGTLESQALPGFCLGIWDEWVGACIDPLAAQLVPCANNSDGCGVDARTWAPNKTTGTLSVQASWGGGTARSGPLLTQVGGVPTSLFVQAPAQMSPPPRVAEAQVWETNIEPAVAGTTRIKGGASGECLGAPTEGATSTNVWARWLENGDVALLLFNLGDTPTTVTCDPACLGRLQPLGDSPAALRWSARDTWTHAAVGTVDSAKGFTTPSALPASGGSMLLRLTPLR